MYSQPQLAVDTSPVSQTKHARKGREVVVVEKETDTRTEDVEIHRNNYIIKISSRERSSPTIVQKYH